MNPIELIGLFASVMLIIPMLIPLKDKKQIILFRVLNNVACIAFIIYGFMLPAYATAICNIIVFSINLFYIIKNCIALKRAHK